MSRIFSAMRKLFRCLFLLGCTSDALSARRASQTKRSLPLRTTAVMGAVMIPSSSKTADRSGRSLFHEVPAAQLEKMLGVSKYQFQDAMKYPAGTVKKAMDILQSGVHDIKTGNADAEHVFLFTLSRLMDCIQTGC